MDRHDVLAAVGRLPGRTLQKLYEQGRELGEGALRPGIWLGRNGDMPAPLKWAVRRIVRRDWFAKLLLDDGRGINVRVRQDGTYAFRRKQGRLVVDLPFRVTPAGLDYGLHVLGRDVPQAVQLRDFVRGVSFTELRDALTDRELAEVDVKRDAPCDEGILVVGLIAPLGARRLAGTPFGMVWDREATDDEQADARAYLGRPRLWDSRPTGA